MEYLCAAIHCSRVKLLVIVIYRPPPAPNNQFFDDFADMLERMASYSSPALIVGDLNLYLDAANNADTAKFESLLAASNYKQHVSVATHVGGHLLDMVLTRDELGRVPVVDVSPPGGLSDHSLIVCQLDVCAPDHYSTVTQLRRCWRSFDLGAFQHDLNNSSLVTLPPENVDDLFSAYHSTLSTLLDKHAPLRRQRLSTRRSEPWYDGECRASKRLTRRLERVNRRCHTESSRTAWMQQFQAQRQLFRRKSEAYWTSTITDCRGDSRKLWSKVGQLLKPSTVQPNQHTAANLANHFTSKVRNIHASTADAEPPTISYRSTPATPLSVLRTVTVEEAAKLLAMAPSKHCSLDPVPSWLLKQASASVAPILASLCNQAFADFRLPMSEIRLHKLEPGVLHF